MNKQCIREENLATVLHSIVFLLTNISDYPDCVENNRTHFK